MHLLVGYFPYQIKLNQQFSSGLILHVMYVIYPYSQYLCSPPPINLLWLRILRQTLWIENRFCFPIVKFNGLKAIVNSFVLS